MNDRVFDLGKHFAGPPSMDDADRAMADGECCAENVLQGLVGTLVKDIRVCNGENRCVFCLISKDGFDLEERTHWKRCREESA